MVCVLGCREQSSTAAAQLAVLETKSKDPSWIQSSPRLEFGGLVGGSQCWHLEKQLETRLFFRHACWRGNCCHWTCSCFHQKHSLRSQGGDAGWEKGGITSSLPLLLPNSSSCWYSKFPRKLSELPCCSNESTFLLWLASVYGMGSVFHN